MGHGGGWSPDGRSLLAVCLDPPAPGHLLGSYPRAVVCSDGFCLSASMSLGHRRSRRSVQDGLEQLLALVEQQLVCREVGLAAVLEVEVVVEHAVQQTQPGLDDRSLCPEGGQERPEARGAQVVAGDLDHDVFAVEPDREAAVHPVQVQVEPVLGVVVSDLDLQAPPLVHAAENREPETWSGRV